MPNTMTRGEIIGKTIVEVIDHIIVPGEPENCDKPKNKIVKIPFLFFELEACTITVPAYLSNATILPGSSGSPVVDMWGNVVAVAFASNSDSNWGLFITNKDVKDFLSVY
jgi:hypothetical protein